MNTHTGSFLKQVIKNQGFIQTEVADKMNTSHANLSKQLSKKDLSTVIIRNLEKATGLTIELVVVKKNNNLEEPREDYNSAESIRKRGRPILVKTETEQQDEVSVLKTKLQGMEELNNSLRQIIESKQELIDILRDKN